MKVALVHDWLTGMRGGEAVLEAMAELFPRAHLFTLLHVPNSVSPTLTALNRTTSFLQRWPQIERRYRHYLPFFPRAIESLDLKGYDLILSSSHCVAKGVRKPCNSVHVSYVHAPMRYFWRRYADYFGRGRASWPVRAAAGWLRPRMQAWDRRSSLGVDRFVANSHYIAGEVRQYYGRECSVVHPFVNEAFLKAGAAKSLQRRSEYYLMVSALVPYKRVDLAIEAFGSLGRPLRIVGGGPEKSRLQALAPSNVEFLGNLSQRALVDLYSKCRALVFPGVEDFGITPLEAMACGAPVIALAKGGLLETVTEQTGVFFSDPSPQALVETVRRFEVSPGSISEAACRARAAQFTRQRFKSELLDQIERALGAESRAQVAAEADAQRIGEDLLP